MITSCVIFSCLCKEKCWGQMCRKVILLVYESCAAAISTLGCVGVREMWPTSFLQYIERSLTATTDCKSVYFRCSYHIDIIQWWSRSNKCIRFLQVPAVFNLAEDIAILDSQDNNIKCSCAKQASPDKFWDIQDKHKWKKDHITRC